MGREVTPGHDAGRSIAQMSVELNLGSTALGQSPLHLRAGAGTFQRSFPTKMNPGRSSPLRPSPRPCRRSRCPAAALVVTLLLAASPFPAVAARPAAVAVRPSTPHTNLPSIGRPINPGETESNALSRLNRLASPPAQGYDIVPPAQPVKAVAGPLPGYQITRLGRAHYNRLCLAATIGGTKGLMMLDTGAQTTALSEATYRSLLSNAAYALPAGLPRAVDFNGTRAPLAEAPDLYVGGTNLGAVPVCLLPRSYLLDPSPLDKKGRLYDGLLGENILRHYNALVDCGRLMLYLNIDPARKLNLSSSFVRHGWTRVVMSDTGGGFTVPCVLNGHSFRLLVDTGAPFTNLDRHLLAAAQIASHDLPVRGGLIGTNAVQAGLVDLDRLQIGDYTATGVHMTTTAQSLAAFGGPNSRRTDVPIVGLLGGDTLATNGAVVDIGNRVLYLKHPPLKAAKGRQEASTSPR